MTAAVVHLLAVEGESTGRDLPLAAVGHRARARSRCCACCLR